MFEQMTIFDFLDSSNIEPKEEPENEKTSLPENVLPKPIIKEREIGKERISDEEAKALFAQCIKEVQDIGIPMGTLLEELHINPRATRRWGCCTHKRKRGTIDEFGHIIEVSERLLYCTEEAIKTTMIHELLHTCKGCDNHGYLWKAYADKVNRAYGYNVKRTTSTEEKGWTETIPYGTKYVLKCSECGKFFFYTKKSRAVKSPHFFTHNMCGGKLTNSSIEEAEEYFAKNKKEEIA